MSILLDRYISPRKELQFLELSATPVDTTGRIYNLTGTPFYEDFQLVQVDESGKIPDSLLPQSVLGGLKFQGTWNPNTNTPTLSAASSANTGFYYVVSVSGTSAAPIVADWQIGDWIVSNGVDWDRIDTQTESLGELVDVTITSPAAGQFLQRNSGNNGWINSALSLPLTTGTTAQYLRGDGTFQDFNTAVSGAVDTYIVQTTGNSLTNLISQSGVTQAIDSALGSITGESISSGTTTGSILTWDGSAWTEDTDVVVGATDLTVTKTGDIALNGGGLGFFTATPVVQQAAPSGINEGFELFQNYGLISAGTIDLVASTTGSSTAITMSQSAITEAISIAISGESLPVGTVTGSILTWNGSDWVQNTTLSVTSGGTASATGTTSMAWGVSTQANAGTSTAWGQNSIAARIRSTAWGSGTQATGDTSTAWGNNTIAGGLRSTAFGTGTQAIGQSSVAFGESSVASGNSSTAFGIAAIANSARQTTIGSFSTDVVPIQPLFWDWDDELFKIGNGVNTANRSDALIVYKNATIEIGPARNPSNNAVLASATTANVGTITNRLYNIGGELYWNGEVLATGTGSTISDGATVNSTLRWDGTDWIEATNLLNDGASITANSMTFDATGATFNGAQVVNFTQYTASTTLPNNSNLVFIEVSGGTVNLTLPATPLNGQTIKFKDTGNANVTNRVQVTANAGQTIEGGNIDTDEDFVSFDLLYNANNATWFLIN